MGNSPLIEIPPLLSNFKEKREEDNITANMEIQKEVLRSYASSPEPNQIQPLELK